jgi:hypothetical protein
MCIKSQKTNKDIALKLETYDENKNNGILCLPKGKR